MISAIVTRRGSGTPQTSGRLAWRGRSVRDEQRELIGTIEEIYVAEETAMPDWALVRAAGSASDVAFLPLQESRSEGDEVIVPFTKAQFTNAPQTQASDMLSPEQGARLYDHYGIGETKRQPDLLFVGDRERERSLDDQVSRFWLLFSALRPQGSVRGAANTTDKRQPSRTNPNPGEADEDDKQR
jgi:hypothetical protein